MVNKINAGNSDFKVTNIMPGCMRIPEMSVKDVSTFIQTALDAGANFFEHADIYGGGRSEEVFGEAVKISAIARDKMLLQSKVGVRPGISFDFSTEHILKAVDGCLKRLGTDYLDSLLLHRPDTLFEPEQVAAAFDKLQDSGKVLHFGVSNQNPMQIELLKKYIRQPIIFNQLQFSLMHTGMIDQGIYVNMKNPGSIDHDGGILDYCRLNNITIQAWSPFQYGFFDGVFIGNDKFPELNAAIDKIAKKYNIPAEAVAVAWILRHPAKMQVVLGTTKTKRLKDCFKASKVKLTHTEWYDLYQAAGNKLP
jgi:predicted oxidoreductase